MQETAILIDDV